MTIRRFRVFWDFDKEEAWLAQMAAQGRLLSKKKVLYSFEESQTGGVVRVDYRDSMSAADFVDYVTMFADAGWRHVGGGRSGGPHYFTTVGSADVDIFSDRASRAGRYRRSMNVHGVLFVVFVATSIALVVGPQGYLSMLTSPSQWYLTPGLWEMSGLRFLFSFLFESVFVLFRVGLPLVAVGFGIYCGAVTIAQYRLYSRDLAVS